MHATRKSLVIPTGLSRQEPVNFPYLQDFGSILAFTENNFGLGRVYPNTKIYADYGAPDWSPDHKTHVPLSDFFGLSAPRPFVSITTSEPASFFQSYYANTGATPTGPDGGPDDD